MAGIYIFRRGEVTGGVADGYFYAKKLIQLLKKQKVSNVSYIEYREEISPVSIYARITFG